MNPLLLFFMILGLVLLGLSVALVLFQRRMFQQQKEQVKELLAEAKKIAEEEAAERAGRD